MDGFFITKLTVRLFHLEVEQIINITWNVQTTLRNGLMLSQLENYSNSYVSSAKRLHFDKNDFTQII